MPEVTISPVAPSDKGVFAQHFQDYLGELARLNGAKPNRRGLYEYGNFDLYWEDNARKPFFVEESGQRVGLLLLRELTEGDFSNDGPSLQVAEIYVFGPHRRRGIGAAIMRAAAQMAEQLGLPLTWSAYMNNYAANALYASILREFASKNRAWATSRTSGIDTSGLARFYYRMTPPRLAPQAHAEGTATRPETFS